MTQASQTESNKAHSGKSVSTAKPFTSNWPHDQTRTVPAGQFKAKCLKLLDKVAETREPLIITKFGKPVARLVPVSQQHEGLRGALRGAVL